MPDTTTETLELAPTEPGEDLTSKWIRLATHHRKFAADYEDNGGPDHLVSLHTGKALAFEECAAAIKAVSLGGELL